MNREETVSTAMDVTHPESGLDYLDSRQQFDQTVTVSCTDILVLLHGISIHYSGDDNKRGPFTSAESAQYGFL